MVWSWVRQQQQVTPLTNFLSHSDWIYDLFYYSWAVFSYCLCYSNLYGSPNCWYIVYLEPVICCLHCLHLLVELLFVLPYNDVIKCRE
jgi:hypothetical protein